MGKSEKRFFRINNRVIIIFVIIITSYVAYAGIFSHPFIDYDDRAMIVDRIDAYDGISKENIINIIAKDFPREEPLILRDLTYLINAELFGPLNSFGYLFGNFFLHLVVCYLVFALILRLFPDSYYLAILSTIIFALHPIHVESVAWISSRKDPLYAMFYLLALIQYIAWLKLKNPLNLLGSLLFFICALLSKIAAISFFITIFMFRLIVDRKTPQSAKERGYFLAVFIITLVYTKWYSGVLHDWGVLNNQLVTIQRDWLVWFYGNCEYFSFYWLKFLFPIEQSTFYDFPASPLVYQNIAYLLCSILFIVIYFYVTFLLWRRGHVSLVFFCIFSLTALLPYMGLTQIQIYVADRYAYLASIGFCVVISYCLFSILNWINLKERFRKQVVLIGVIFISTFLCLKTVRATNNWSSTVAFWENAVFVAPKTAATYAGLMKHYHNMYKYSKDKENVAEYLIQAEKIGEMGIDAICPSRKQCGAIIRDLTDAMAIIKWSLNKNEEAEFYFRSTLNLTPGYFQSRYEYMTFLIEKKRYSEAFSQLQVIENNGVPYSYNGMLKEIEEKWRPEIEIGLQTNSQK